MSKFIGKYPKTWTLFVPRRETMSLCFFVPGIPAPGGSKRAFRNKYTGKIVLVDAAGQKNKDWRAAVATVAFQEMAGRQLYTGAIGVTLEFFVPRPKSHFNSKGQLRPHAPRYPIGRPDVLKLARSTEDAMTSIVWRDDSLTVDLFARKSYPDNRYQSAGALITVIEMPLTSGQEVHTPMTLVRD